MLPLLQKVAEEQPHPLLFATVSGAHLYGFASPDSDFDIRGVHVLPAEAVLGLDPPEETVEVSRVIEGKEIDLVTHDARKFFTLMLRRNGYVLEQLFSPLVVQTKPVHDELKALGRGCVTKHHVHHYSGFAHSEWTRVQKDETPKLKPLLYTYRVLLTGIHLMRSGAIEANLSTLAAMYREEVLPDLIARKVEGREKGELGEPLDPHRERIERLFARLEEEAAASTLREEPITRQELSDLLVRLRLVIRLRQVMQQP